MFLYPCCLKYLAWINCHVHKFGIYIEQEKERVKEKLGGRPAKLNEKKGDRQNTKEKFFAGRTTRKFCSGGDKMRNVGHLI